MPSNCHCRGNVEISASPAFQEQAARNSTSQRFLFHPLTLCSSLHSMSKQSSKIVSAWHHSPSRLLLLGARFLLLRAPLDDNRASGGCRGGCCGRSCMKSSGCQISTCHMHYIIDSTAIYRHGQRVVSESWCTCGGIQLALFLQACTHQKCLAQPAFAITLYCLCC